MRILKGGVAHVAERIEDDLKDRDTGLQKPHRAGLSDLVSCALSTRCANAGEWAGGWISVLPRILGDQFYGTSSLIVWCQKNRWQYRLRLQGNLILEHKGGKITTGEAVK